MTEENVYTESEVLAAIAAYRNLERAATHLYTEDIAIRQIVAKSILETSVESAILNFVPEEIRKKVDITQIVYHAKEVLGLERSVEEAALKK